MAFWFTPPPFPPSPSTYIHLIHFSDSTLGGVCWEQEHSGKHVHFSYLNLNPQPTVSGEKMHMSLSGILGTLPHTHTHTYHKKTSSTHMSTIPLILCFSHIHTAVRAFEECQGLHSRAGLQYYTREYSLPSADKAGWGGVRARGLCIIHVIFGLRCSSWKASFAMFLLRPCMCKRVLRRCCLSIAPVLTVSRGHI